MIPMPSFVIQVFLVLLSDHSLVKSVLLRRKMGRGCPSWRLLRRTWNAHVGSRLPGRVFKDIQAWLFQRQVGRVGQRQNGVAGKGRLQIGHRVVEDGRGT